MQWPQSNMTGPQKKKNMPGMYLEQRSGLVQTRSEGRHLQVLGDAKPAGSLEFIASGAERKCIPIVSLLPQLSPSDFVSSRDACSLCTMARAPINGSS